MSGSFVAMNKKLVILGNGPSLKDFDFKSLKNVDSLGMNAAYRYWERIGWYPTHYVCLDDQLIETHADAIHDLITTGKVETAFLIAKILDYHPDLLKYPNVFYLESFHGARQKRVADKGVPFISSLPFKESDPSKVTTGAYSVRFGGHLGYKEITILGVDLRYVEIIPEARSNEGIKLVMAKTPSSNPNYFFDDYQQAGDKYNIPNPASHGRNLHVAAFEVVANDVVQFGWSAKITNSNRTSVLYDQAIFPYQDINSFISKRSLSAVVVPTTSREIAVILKNLLIWDKPMLAPSIYSDRDDKPDLVFAFSSAENTTLTKQIEDAVAKSTYLKRYFEQINVKFVNLDKSLDYYQKDYGKKIGGRGYKSGPNEQFFELMTLLSGYDGFIFYMETDCVPLRQGWLDEVRTLAEGDNESWVIGSYYRGIEKISNRFAIHLNGNALYRVGDPEFIEFIETFWRPQLYKVLESIDKRMAYDCFPAYFFTAADPRKQNVEWKIFQEVGHRFRATSLIQNISGAADKELETSVLIRQMLTQSPDTFLAHGLPFQKLLHQKFDEFAADEKRPFYWGEIIGEVSIPEQPQKYAWKRATETSAFPKLLMIDSTAVGHQSATGQLKQTFLENWPKSSFLQIWGSGGQHSSFHAIELGQSIDESRKKTLFSQEVIEKCRSFAPDVIYFRPIDSEPLLELAEQIAENLNKPLVIHMMDDWPERLHVMDSNKFSRLDASLRRLIGRASKHLSICDQMSKTYNARYGGNWHSLANGVDPTVFPYRDWGKRAQVSKTSPFVIRYMGGLADDMTYASIKDIAKAVAALQSELPVCFEVYTMEWYRVKAEQEIDSLPGVSIHSLVDKDKYQHCLSSADALVIAYNFDPKSISYIGLSLANKMPECLASGVPLLAYGPSGVATIDTLKKAGCAHIVDHRDNGDLQMAVRQLVTQPDYCQSLGEKARNHVAQNLTKQIVQQKFQELVMVPQKKVSGPLVGNFFRDQKVNGGKPVVPAVKLGANAPAKITRPQKERITIRPGDHFTPIAEKLWRYQHSDALQKLWMATFDIATPIKGQKFVAGIRLKSDRSMTVSVSLGRDGPSAYEGVSKPIKLLQGKLQNVKLFKEFTNDHKALKIQLDVLETEGDAVQLQIDSFYIVETMNSIRKRMGETKFNIREANMMSRDGDFSTAMGIYLHLHKQRSLKMYADNALMAAHKLKLASIQSVDELQQLVDK